MTLDAPRRARYHSVVQAMYLLSGSVASSRAQHCALHFLRKDCGLLSDWPRVLQNLLPQLVRMLLEQRVLTTPLTLFLLEAAVLAPLTTGLELFWILQSQKDKGSVRAGQVLARLMSMLDCGLLRGVYQDQLRLWGQQGVFHRLYKDLSLKPLVTGTENAPESPDSSALKLARYRSLRIVSSQTNILLQDELVNI